MVDRGKPEQSSSRQSHTLDRKRVYTSQFNARVISPDLPENVMIFDTTLRDGEQTPGIALSIEDKVQIANALSDLGVDVIEAGFPTSSSGEREAIRKIVDQGLQSRVCGLARCNKKDIDAALDCGLDYIHTFIATSDCHLQYKLKMTREEVRGRAVEAIEYAKSHGVTVEFSCEDATRTDLDFLKEMHLAVQEAGVDKINVPDTVGTISPAAMEYLIGELMTVTKVPIAVHCHDDFGLAVANSLSAVRAGARQVHVTMNGLGERAGNAALEETVLGLMAFYNVGTNIETRMIGPTSRLVAKLTGYPVPPIKAIVGNNAFAHESGIHVHGVLGAPSTYEAFGPELVGVQRSIVMGKHTGAHSVRTKLAEYGVDMDDGQINLVVDRIKRLADSGKEVDDAELVALASHILGERESEKVKLKEFAVFTGMNITPTAVVSIEVNGERKTGSATGIGPVDAAINAIKLVMGNDISLVEYRLNAITGGSDALCEVSVRVARNGGKTIMSVGKAIGSDIVQTSVDSTMEALDRLYCRKKE
ncbi:MAG: 2-isopropylmalate synthase [Euryarchaeota archaeon]|nr:2-isopropylmalate synthase [Euryarchaeota archaeon]